MLSITFCNLPHLSSRAASAIAVLGAHNVFIQTEPTQQRIFCPGTNFVTHEGWSAQTLHNDLAVIQLPQPANYGQFIRSVRLPNRRQSDLTFAGQGAIVSGWGRTQNWNNGKRIKHIVRDPWI